MITQNHSTLQKLYHQQTVSAFSQYQSSKLETHYSIPALYLSNLLNALTTVINHRSHKGFSCLKPCKLWKNV